jgi:porin
MAVRRAARVRVLLSGLLLLWSAPLLRAQDAQCGDGACPGLDLAAGYTADFRRNTRGGIARGNAASGLLEAGLAWRSDSLLPGAMVTTSASLIHVGGDAISGELVGDLQGLNNIEADAGWYLYDLWTEVSFGARQAASVRAGFLDLNAEFDTSDTAGFFIGPPFGIGTDLAQTGENGPGIFPVTALGLRFGGTLGDGLQWRIAAYEGTPGRTDRHRFATASFKDTEGALLIGELDFTPRHLHKLAFGAWSYTAGFQSIDAAATDDARRRRGNHGAYAMVDAPLGSPGGLRLDGMLRAGVADARFNPVGTYVGGALVASNLLASRPDDAVGIAVAHARTGSRFRRALAFEGGAPTSTETAVELTWRAPLLQSLAVVPSVQWIAAPGADRSRRNAFVAGLRFEVSFERSWTQLARATPAERDFTRVASSQLSQ